MKVEFNKPAVLGDELKFIKIALDKQELCGDRHFGLECQNWFEKELGCLKALMTPSCTHALEMAAILANIQCGDEVIMPSYTFVSTANAFVLRGAKIVFVDIREDTLNIDETKIEAAITGKTKAIVPVHYAGYACEMDKIMEIADRYSLFVIEDAAQGLMSSYKGKPLGTIGHFGAYSFHETKNYTSGGEGGALLVNVERFIEKSEIIREKGTNRSKFINGIVDKYTWVNVGSSYLPSELQSAYLYAQLLKADEINTRRKEIWQKYYGSLYTLSKKNKICLPQCDSHKIEHNAHMFYIKLRDEEERQYLMDYLKHNGITAPFHYIPLHSSEAGMSFGSFHGDDKNTTLESKRLLRLPLYYNLSDKEVNYVIKCILAFFENDE